MKDPIKNVVELRKAIESLVNPDCIDKWFKTPNEGFDGLTPTEVVERGETYRLWEMVHRLK